MLANIFFLGVSPVLLALLGLWLTISLGLLIRRGRTTIPGPIGARFSRFWLLRVLCSGNSAEIFAEVNRKYGSLARISPNHVMTDDPETIRRVLARNSPYVRAPMFDLVKADPQSNNVIAERDPKRHAALKSKLAPGYFGKAVEDPETTIDSQLTRWIDILHGYECLVEAASSKFDLAKSVQYLIVDIISKISLGVPFGNVETNSDRYDFLKMVQAGALPVLVMSVLPEVYAIIYWLTKWSWIHHRLVPAPTNRQGIGRTLEVIEEAIEQSLRSGMTEKSGMKERSNMVGVFLTKDLARHQLREELLIALVTGSETTITAVQGIILGIIGDARVNTKLNEEIDKAVNQGLISKPVTFNEARKLPYLQACIMEGIRKNPPIGQLRERLVPPGGDSVLGHYLEGGTIIGLNLTGLQMNSIFGADPEVFRPERWLIDDQVQLQAMYRVNDLNFGYGPTRCLGIEIAMMKIYKIVFELFRNFDISIVDPIKPCNRICLGVYFTKDLNVYIRSRT